MRLAKRGLVARWGLGAVLFAALLPLACGSDGQNSNNAGGAGGEGGDAAAENAGSGGGGGSGGEPSGSSGASPEGGAGGAGSAPTVELSEYCSEFSEEYFRFLSTCYGSLDYPEELHDDFVTDGTNRCLKIEASIDDGRLTFDGARAAACIAELKDAECTPFNFLMRAPSCDALFAPQVERGGDCYYEATVNHSVIGAASECQDGYCSDDACPGSCLPWLQLGEACESGQCAPELACIDQRCRRPRRLNEPCPSDDACAAGLTCVGDTCREPSQLGAPCFNGWCSTGYNCLDGKCRAKVETGEYCQTRYDCADGEQCVDRGIEAPEGLKCGPPGKVGVNCYRTEDCAADLYCRLGGGELGSCQKRVPISGKCEMNACQDGAWCNLATELCQAVGEEGDSCLEGMSIGPSWACAPGLHCMSDGKCHPPGDIGEPCYVWSPDTCAAGRVCDRQSALCQLLPALGQYCNPQVPEPCAGGLGCLCTGPDCAGFTPTDQHDTQFTCAPRREPGESCLNTPFECANDGYCDINNGPPVCRNYRMCW